MSNDPIRLASACGLVVAAATAITALTMSHAAWAASQTVVLSLKMTCPMSEPPLIELLLSRVAGVSSVEVSFDDQSATVTFDDQQADVDALKAVVAEFAGDQPSSPASDDDDM